MLVAVIEPGRPSSSWMAEETRAEIDPLQTHALEFGVQVHALAEGVALALAPEELTVADGAGLLARFGEFVREIHPRAHLALATGSAVTGARARLPVGEAIDRGVTMVRWLEPGSAQQGVQVDESSAALLSSRFDVRREDDVLYLAGERVSLDPTRPLLGRPTSCVGREQELTILDATYAECARGDGPKIVLVTAPSGAGKSRLRHELLRRIGSSPDEPCALHCHGDPLHLATPYALIAQAVRQMARLHDRVPASELRERIRQHVASLLPENDVLRVTDFLGELVGATFDDDEHIALKAARHNETAMADQIRAAFEDILRAWTKAQPVMLVLEDLHWSDALSIKLLDGVLRKLGGHRLMAVALARPEVHERFPLLWSKRHVTEIRLPPLSPPASRNLVHEAMGPTSAKRTWRASSVAPKGMRSISRSSFAPRRKERKGEAPFRRRCTGADFRRRSSPWRKRVSNVSSPRFARCCVRRASSGRASGRTASARSWETPPPRFRASSTRSWIKKPSSRRSSRVSPEHAS